MLFVMLFAIRRNKSLIGPIDEENTVVICIEVKQYYLNFCFKNKLGETVMKLPYPPKLNCLCRTASEKQMLK